MGKAFAVGVLVCAAGGVASSGSCSPEELRSPSVSQSAVSTKDERHQHATTQSVPVHR